MLNNPEKSFELNRTNMEQTVKWITEDGKRGNPGERKSLEFFKDFDYDEAEIEKDERLLNIAYKRIEESMKNTDDKEEIEKSNERGRAMEIVMTYVLEQWFETENIEVAAERTTEYDDVINGVDLIVEFKTPDSIESLALGIDASLHTKGIREKMHRCYRRMTDPYENFQVKYFRSVFQDENGENYCGPLKNVIPAIVGLGPKNANKLFENFAEYLSLRNNKDFHEAQNKMSSIVDNPIKKIILGQIKNQLEMYKVNSGKVKKELLDEIDKISKIIEKIENSEEMKGVVCSFDQEDDSVFRKIKSYTNAATKGDGANRR